MGFMSEYKTSFEERNNVKWEYSSDKLLDKYLKFKATRESIIREPKKEKELYDGGQLEMKSLKMGKREQLQ